MESSSFGRLIGALVAPGKTFRAIAERPTWAVALIVLLAAGTVVGVLANQRLDKDELRQTIKERIEKGQGQASAEQVERGVEMAEKVSSVTRWLIPVFAAAVYLLTNLFFWMAFRFFAGSGISYKTSFSVLLHAFLPQVISAVLTLPVLLSRESIGMEEARSGILASSLAAFAPEDTGKVLRSLLSSLDFFSIWTLILLVIGYHLAARVSKGTAAAIVLVLWALYVGGKVGLATLFG
ncbi:MAG TPA: YIP1 family protein [Thermoanaerobaculia bacterium]|jgi:hypothetical protein|nr:YIP1 family protein [Thermoanaerobaculia bacterium]